MITTVLHELSAISFKGEQEELFWVEARIAQASNAPQWVPFAFGDANFVLALGARCAAECAGKTLVTSRSSFRKDATALQFLKEWKHKICTASPSRAPLVISLRDDELRRFAATHEVVNQVRGSLSSFATRVDKGEPWGVTWKVNLGDPALASSFAKLFSRHSVIRSLMTSVRKYQTTAEPIAPRGLACDGKYDKLEVPPALQLTHCVRVDNQWARGRFYLAFDRPELAPQRRWEVEYELASCAGISALVGEDPVACLEDWERRLDTLPTVSQNELVNVSTVGSSALRNWSRSYREEILGDQEGEVTLPIGAVLANAELFDLTTLRPERASFCGSVTQERVRDGAPEI